MKFYKTSLSKVYLIEPFTNFTDHRGNYAEIFNKKKFNQNFRKIKFVEDDISTSKYKVLRGIHGDFKTCKLVSCLFGSFFLVVVNNIRRSKEYLKHTTFILSDKNRKQVLIPPGFGNAHLVLSKTAIFHYKQSEYYNRNRQFTLKWNDPKLKIKWPLRNPILSKRDK